VEVAVAAGDGLVTYGEALLEGVDHGCEKGAEKTALRKREIKRRMRMCRLSLWREGIRKSRVD